GAGRRCAAACNAAPLRGASGHGPHGREGGAGGRPARRCRSTRMRIDRRFAGPPTSANGGVTCGLLAAHVDAPVVEVTLRRPPPLDVDMRMEDGSLYDEDVLVATARPGTIDLEPHPAVTVEQARAAAPSYAGLT